MRDNSGVMYSVITGAVVASMLVLNFAAAQGKQAPVLGGSGYEALDEALTSRSILDAKQAFVLTAARAAGERAISDVLHVMSENEPPVDLGSTLETLVQHHFLEITGLNAEFEVKEFSGQAVDRIAMRVIDIPPHDSGIWISSKPIDIGGANVVVKISLPADLEW